MKKPILLSVILVMTALGDTMQAEVDMVGVFMDAIAEVESGGRDIGRHADGISVGKYGVTAFAVAELRRVGVLPPVPVIDLFNPHDNALVAREYLLLMLKRHGYCWGRALGAYHGGSEKAQDEYATKVFRVAMAQAERKGANR